MIDFFSKLFDTSDFPRRWDCGVWSSGDGWLHILSDLATFGAYVAIPFTMLWVVRHRKREVAFPRVVWLFAAFIFACGFVHLVEAIIFWHPIYRVSGVLKFITAVVSWMTLVACVRVAPSLLSMPGLVALNVELREEIQARRKAEQRLTAILASMSDGVMVSDRDGNFEMINPAAVEAFGFEQEDKDFQERLNRYALYVDGGQKQLVGDDLPLRSAARGNVMNNTEVLISCPSRDIFRVIRLSTRQIMRDDNDSHGAVAVFHDITEMKQIEDERNQQFQLLERITTTAAQVAEATQTDSDDNRGVMRVIASIFACPVVLLTVYQDDEIVRVRRFRVDETDPDDEGTIDQFDVPAAELSVPFDAKRDADAFPIASFELNNVTYKNCAAGRMPQGPRVGGAMILARRTAAYSNDDLDLLRRVSWMIAPAVFTKDRIELEKSARILAEAKLENSRKQLDRLSRINAVGEMTAGIAHELNQPLTALINFSDAAHLLACHHDASAKGSRSSEQLQDLTRKCNEQAVRAANVLRSLRGLIQKEASEFVSVHLMKLVSETCQLLGDEAAASDATVDLSGVDPELHVEVDPTQLQQVLVNLIRNALNSVAGCEKRIILITTRVSDTRWTMDVSDTGQGIPEGDRDQLFDAFFTTNASGLGLGLKICRSIVELHGGQIHATNNPDVGATFSVELPIHQN